ncbi:MAG: hypothetical protein WA160_04005 [Pseudobdellovibrio sp.]
MAKLKRVLIAFSEKFVEYIERKDTLIEKSQVDFEYTIEQAKLKAYSIRRNAF